MYTNNNINLQLEDYCHGSMTELAGVLNNLGPDN